MYYTDIQILPDTQPVYATISNKQKLELEPDIDCPEQPKAKIKRQTRIGMLSACEVHEFLGITTI